MELRDLGARDMEPCDDGALDSPSLQVFGTAMRSVGPDVGRAVFLHTGWRSGGTWIWSLCRASRNVCGFYEPLHEQVARFRRRDVGTMRPGSWQSNHSDTPPYFEEYRELIPRRGRGVVHYDSRFAFDHFFRAPDEPSDPDLENYLAMLLSGPRARGQVPVLKFCRSMGRVGWLENLFPQALHLVVLRDPLAQFRSIQALLEKQRNRYFALAPLLVLARNAQHPAVRDAAATLGVSLPSLFSDDMDYAVETCWRHVRRLPAAEHYRGFLAFWTLCAMAALDSEALVIDMDSVGTNPAHRAPLEAALQAQIGEPIRLQPRQASRGAGATSLPPGAAEAHGAALNLLRARGGRLPAERRELISAKLQSAAGATFVRGWTAPVLPPPAGPRSTLQRLATRAAVLMARAVQPLRRLHGALVWHAPPYQAKSRISEPAQK